MKKVVFYLLIIVMGLGVSQLKAQTGLSYGVKAEANMSNYLLSDLDDMKSTMKVGASLGGFMNINLSENFAVQPELLFHYKASEYENKPTGIKNDYEYWGMEIPVYAVGQMNLGTGKGYVGFGPYAGLGFSYKNTTADLDLYKKYENDDKATMSRWDFGLACMLGYEFNNKIQINASYKMGLIDNLDAGKDDATMRTQTVSLGVGYRF